MRISAFQCSFRHSGRSHFFVSIPAAAMICLVMIVHVHALDFYVSPVGDDNHNGSSPASAVRTLEKARDLVRAVPSMSEDIVVHLLEGRYYLSTPVVFDERDGGRNGHRVIYRSYGTSKAVICGGLPVTGWQETGDKGIWKAPVEGVTRKIRTFSVNGRAGRMAELRGGAYARGEYQVDKGILFDGNRYYANGGDIEITRKILFMQHHASVKEILKVGDQVAYVMQQPLWSLVLTAPYVEPKGSGAWGVRNARELLDTEGEFYYDRSAATLYYKPYADQDMKSADAVAAVSEGLIKITGALLQRPVRNLEFWGLTFSHDSWQMMQIGNSYGSTGTQSVALIVEKSPDPGRFAHPDLGNSDGLELPQAAVEVSFATGIHFERNTFEHCGSMAISLINGVDSSAIIGNRFRDIASTAINVGHPKHGVLGDHPEFIGGERQPRFITVTNNHIREACTEYLQAQPVVTFFTDGLELSHNDIHKSPYSTISVGYGWQDFNNLPAESITCRDVRVRNNRLSGSCRHLGDGGAIYALGRMEGENEFSGNFVYCDPDNEGFNCRGQNWGLYADQGPKQAVWKNNVVENYDIWMNSLRDPGSQWKDNWTTSDKQEWRANEPVNTGYYSLGSRPQQVQKIFENSGLEPAYRTAWDGSIRDQVTTVYSPITAREQLPEVNIRKSGMSGVVVTLDPKERRSVTVFVSDAKGRTILRHRFAENAPRSILLPLAGGADGIRIVRVQVGASKSVSRMIMCQ